MIPVLLILIPLLTGLAAFFFKQDKAIRIWSLGVSLLTLVVSIIGGEVALYVQKNFIKELKKLESYKRKDYRLSL